MYCRKCGNPIDNKTVFCKICGEKIIKLEQKSYRRIFRDFFCRSTANKFFYRRALEKKMGCPHIGIKEERRSESFAEELQDLPEQIS